MKGCVLAVDLGGSGLRAALIGGDGGQRSFCDFPTRSADEADPAAWWRHLIAAAAMLRAARPRLFAGVRAIAITGFTRSLVLLGGDGAVLRPAMLFGDARAAGLLDDLRRRGAGHDEARRLDATHAAARLAWLARHEPGVIERAAHAVEAKDYLNFRLTGMVASDPISSARLAASRGLLGALGLPALLPPLRRPHETLGAVQAGLPAPLDALAGVPVLTMAHDTWAAVLGLGALRAGTAYCISGTTEVLGLLHDRPAQADGLLTVDWDGLWQIGGPSRHGADLLVWLRDLGLDPADPAPQDPPPILFLPTLEGERVPHWDTGLRGAFLGLRRGHGSQDLARAVMLGVALNSRTVLERAEAAAGRRAAELRLGGGGALPGWAQLRADALGRPVVLTGGGQSGLLGGAIAGFAAVEGRTLEAMQRRLVRDAARFEPDPRRHRRATQLHALFTQAEQAVAPISRALAALS
jgi:xylulokinase